MQPTRPGLGHYRKAPRPYYDDIAAVDEDDHVVIHINQPAHWDRYQVKFRKVLDEDFSACEPVGLVAIGEDLERGLEDQYAGYGSVAPTKKTRDLAVLSRNCPLRVYTNPEATPWLDNSEALPVYKVQTWGDAANEFLYWETSPRTYPKLTAGTAVMGGYALESVETINGKVKPQIHAAMIVVGGPGMRSELIVGWPQRAEMVRYVGPAEHAGDDTQAVATMKVVLTVVASMGIYLDFSLVVLGNRASKNRLYYFEQEKPSNTDGRNPNDVLKAMDYEEPSGMYEFGSPDDDTTAIEIRDVNNDHYFDIVEVNARGISRIYYGTEETSRTFDIASLLCTQTAAGHHVHEPAHPPRTVGLGIAAAGHERQHLLVPALLQEPAGLHGPHADAQVDLGLSVDCAAHGHRGSGHLLAAVPRAGPHGPEQHGRAAHGVGRHSGGDERLLLLRPQV